jgi:hypothetical protein
MGIKPSFTKYWVLVEKTNSISLSTDEARETLSYQDKYSPKYNYLTLKFSKIIVEKYIAIIYHL